MKKLIFPVLFLASVFSASAQESIANNRHWASLINKKDVIGYDTRSYEENKLKIKIFHNLNKGGFSLQVISDNMQQPVSLAIFDQMGNLKETRLLKPGVIVGFGNSYLPGMYHLKAQQGSRLAQLKLEKS